MSLKITVVWCLTNNQRDSKLQMEKWGLEKSLNYIGRYKENTKHFLLKKIISIPVWLVFLYIKLSTSLLAKPLFKKLVVALKLCYYCTERLIEIGTQLTFWQRFTKQLCLSCWKQDPFNSIKRVKGTVVVSLLNMAKLYVFMLSEFIFVDLRFMF